MSNCWFVVCAIGAKSRSVSYGSFLPSAALIAWPLDMTSSV
jgi:hypothetical protein